MVINLKLNSKQEFSYSKNQLHTLWKFRTKRSKNEKHFKQNQAIFQSSKFANYWIKNDMRNTNWRISKKSVSLMSTIWWLMGPQFFLNFGMISMFPDLFPDFPGFQLIGSNDLNCTKQFCNLAIYRLRKHCYCLV